MDVLFCLALDRYLAGTGEMGDGGQEVLEADGWLFIPAFSPTLTNSCTSVRASRVFALKPLLLFFSTQHLNTLTHATAGRHRAERLRLSKKKQKNNVKVVPAHLIFFFVSRVI